MLDRFLEAGGNFIDTADTYSDGGSEETLAPWLARHRDEVVLATKCRFAVSDPGGAGLAPDRIVEGVRRQPAAPRRRRDRPLPGPRARSRRAARGLRSRRSTGSCAPARCARSACRTSRPGCSPGRSRCRTARAGRRSSRCSRSTRSSSARSSSSCCRSAAPPGLGVIPWGPLGAGFLSGRYQRGERPPEGSRIADARDDYEEAYERRAIERNFAVVDAAGEIAEARGVTIAAGRARVAARHGRHDRADRRAAHVRAARGPARRRRAAAEPEERARLEAPAPPPPVYPQRMLREQRRDRIRRSGDA